jgi:hypothetical protein
MTKWIFFVLRGEEKMGGTKGKGATEEQAVEKDKGTGDRPTATIKNYKVI